MTDIVIDWDAEKRATEHYREWEKGRNAMRDSVFRWASENNIPLPIVEGCGSRFFWRCGDARLSVSLSRQRETMIADWRWSFEKDFVTLGRGLEKIIPIVRLMDAANERANDACRQMGELIDTVKSERIYTG